MKIKNLIANPRNPRKIGKGELEGLKNSLQQFGDISGVVFNRRSGQLVAGHQRVRALTEQHGEDLEIFQEGQEGRIKLPDGSHIRVRFVDWDESKEIAALLAANNDNLTGEWTGDVSELIEELELEVPDLVVDVRLDLLEVEAEGIPVSDRGGSNSDGGDGDGSSRLGELEYRIVIDCDSEEHQFELLTRLEKEGLKCSALMS